MLAALEAVCPGVAIEGPHILRLEYLPHQELKTKVKKSIAKKRRSYPVISIVYIHACILLFASDPEQIREIILKKLTLWYVFSFHRGTCVCLCVNQSSERKM